MTKSKSEISLSIAKPPLRHSYEFHRRGKHELSIAEVQFVFSPYEIKEVIVFTVKLK